MTHYQSVIALLFASSNPLEVAKVAELLQISEQDLLTIIEDLETQSADAALIIQHNGDVLQLATNPRYGKLVKQVAALEGVQELTKAAKETLAVIAYKQPIDRGELEAIRGLDCRRTLHTLMQKGLVQQSRAIPPGGDPRAFYYEVSFKFLEYFGLKNVEAFRSKFAAGF